MAYLTGKMRKAVFGISPREASFSRRGFSGGTPEARAHLEHAGGTFVAGYNAALLDPRPAYLVAELGQHDLEYVGFAFEGAAMGLTILDLLTPWNRSRWSRFLENGAGPHVYMVHVGAGWALARLRRPVEPFLQHLHPVLRWLVVDGYGFHQGYFHWKRFVEEQQPPDGLWDYAARVFDQGLGRSLWFVLGADVNRIASVVTGFPILRQPDLWSGVGLASTYAGKVSPSELVRLRELAGSFLPRLAQGASFAAKARMRAGNLTDYADHACQVLCGMTASEAAAMTDEALENLQMAGDKPAFEVWRTRLHESFKLVLRQEERS